MLEPPTYGEQGISVVELVFMIVFMVWCDDYVEDLDDVIHDITVWLYFAETPPHM